MDAGLFTRMLSDKSIVDLRRLGYKYPDADMGEFIELLKSGFYKTLPLRAFDGEQLVYLEGVTRVRMNAVKLLIAPAVGNAPYGQRAMEEEIASSLTIEDINFRRDSVRRIMAGCAPADESETRIFGMKRAFEYISDRANKISEENLHTLYELAIGAYLPEDDRLRKGSFYRHDSVFVVGSRVEHMGLPWQRLNEYMAALVDFINADDGINELLKAAIIHFYIGYLHPYFDGNGRMARIVHLWYLVQRGYPSAMFVPLSEYVEKSRRDYYRAYSLVEQNARVGGVPDVTAFLTYFIDNVYDKLAPTLPRTATAETFRTMLAAGQVTEKERELWGFVSSAYGGAEFSTKQLERDFGNAAYATIRAFVLKFEHAGLLVSARYGSRVKYRIP